MKVSSGARAWGAGSTHPPPRLHPTMWTMGGARQKVRNGSITHADTAHGQAGAQGASDARVAPGPRAGLCALHAAALCVCERARARERAIQAGSLVSVPKRKVCF